MPAVPSTQIPVDYQGQQYSGVYSVSGTLMIARVPGIGSKSIELTETNNDAADSDGMSGAALSLLTEILAGAAAEGRL